MTDRLAQHPGNARLPNHPGNRLRDTLLERLGHRPTPDGRCEHRWRNRVTRIVECEFLSGYNAARSAIPPSKRATGAVDVERLAEALNEEFDFDDMVMGASPEASAERILARLSGESA